LAALLLVFGLKLLGWLISGTVGLMLGTVKLLFMAVCLASFVYFVIQFLPVS
jgi:hypothetical protein